MQPQGAHEDIFKLAQPSTIAFEFPDSVASVVSAASLHPGVAFGGFWGLDAGPSSPALAGVGACSR